MIEEVKSLKFKIMEKEKYQELSPEEVKKFGEENMTEEEMGMSEDRVKDIIKKTKERVLSDAEFIQGGAKYVLEKKSKDKIRAKGKTDKKN